MQPNDAPSRSAELNVRSVVLVERIEGDHLVFRIDRSQQGRDHPFGGAAGDSDLGLGVDGESVSAPILRGDGIAQWLGAQVMAYWFKSASIAARAASLISAGAGKSGNPCARLTAS